MRRQQQEAAEADQKASIAMLEKRAGAVASQEAALKQQQMQLTASTSQLQV